MDTKPKNDVSETNEVTPAESTEKLSPQGQAAMRGDDTAAVQPVMPEPESDVSPPPDTPTPPPPDHHPISSDSKESAPPKKDGREKSEFEQSGPGPEFRG